VFSSRELVVAFHDHAKIVDTNAFSNEFMVFLFINAFCVGILVSFYF
jgi:hypothetical protein